MGGKNHQPTKPGIEITQSSALLSRTVDEATIFLHQSNICIENAILADLQANVAESVSCVNESIRQLHLFYGKINEIVRAWDTVLETAQRHGYRGNPMASQVSALQLDKLFEGTLLRPRILSSVWEELVNRIESENLIPTFQWERDAFRQLEKPVGQLIEVLEICKLAAQKGQLTEQVEGNRIPLRQYFGPVFSAWYYLSAMFLYSAMICTELFYRVNGLGSLAKPASVDEARRITA